MKRITKAQLLILAEIHNFILDEGFPPSLRELQLRRHLDSWHGVECHLTALEAKGLLYREPRLARGLRITEKGTAALWENSIPIEPN